MCPQLQQELSSTEKPDRDPPARSTTTTATQYNTKQQQFPTVLVAGLARATTRGPVGARGPGPSAPVPQVDFFPGSSVFANSARALSRYKEAGAPASRGSRASAEDPAITAAVQAHMAEQGQSEQAVQRQVRPLPSTKSSPHFNVLSYYTLGYNVAKILVNLLYKTSVDYQDEHALGADPQARTSSFI